MSLRSVAVDHQKGHRARLKEKFLRSNHESLHDYEIMELILFNAIPRKDVKPLAKTLLKKYDTIGKIINLSPTELSNFSPSVQVILKLMQEVVSRVCKENISKKEILINCQNLFNYIRASIGYKATECLSVLYLNHKNILITDEIIMHGTVNTVSIYPREILKKAIFYNASSIIIAHNHPSGITKPSTSDIAVTKQLQEVISPLNIALIDHIIMSGSNYYSFKQNCLI